MKKYITAALVLVASILFSENMVQGQAGGIALQQLRRALSTYELENGKTLRHIRKLNQFIDEVTVEHEVNDARVLRATTLANLVVIAYVTNNEKLMSDLAKTMQLSELVFVPFIEQEIEDYARGVEYITGRQAAAALKALRFGYDIKSEELARTSMILRDVLVLSALSQLMNSGQSMADFLKDFADDPCGEQKLVCPKLYAAFEVDGRKSIHALREVGQAIQRLTRAAKMEDPLSSHLLGFTKQIHRKLTSTVLRPSPSFDKSLILTTETGKSGSAIPDAIVTVSRTELKVGFIPGVRLTSSGNLRIITAGKPVFPQTKTVKLPNSYRPYMRNIDSVTNLFSKVFQSDKSISVAVGPAKEVPAHVVGRVLLSLSEIEQHNVFLLGLGPDGSTHVVPMQVISSQQADEMTPAHVNLRIRLGGYTLKLGLGSKEDIPRIKGEEGFQFDIDTLAAKINQRKYRSAEVSFMGDVTSENLVAALFQLASAKDPVRLVIPQ